MRQIGGFYWKMCTVKSAKRASGLAIRWTAIRRSAFAVSAAPKSKRGEVFNG